MLATVALRAALWVTSRRYLRSDEAVVGMETLDILEGGEIPFFMYGQTYGGGHTVDALMALPLVAWFGPVDYLFKTSHVLFSCATVLVVYWCLHRSFGRRYALVGTACFSIFSTFVVFSFFYNAAMAMSFFGWLGLALYFPQYFGGAASRAQRFAAGACMGFACYCFEFATYFLAVVAVLALLKATGSRTANWRSGLWFPAGVVAGASPLVYFNLTRDFAHLKTVLGMTVDSDADGLTAAIGRFLMLWLDGMPAFFAVDLYERPQEVATSASIGYGLFLMATGYALVRMRGAIGVWIRSLVALRPIVLPKEHRVVYLLLMTGLYAVMYSLSPLAGTAPRYLVVFCPLLPLIIAWMIVDLWTRSRVASVLAVALFAALQIQGIAALAVDRTTVEWGVRLHGEDLKSLTRFLLANNLNTVAAPYDIKWRLMLESERRIVCAAYLFGFDREEKYNREVIRRVNRERVPLTFVFDKEYQLAQVASKFNPEAAFSIDGFRAYLARNQISYEVTPVGQDYVVYHGFSPPLRLPDPEDVTTGSDGGAISLQPRF